MNMEINPSEYKILIVDDVMSNVLLLKVLLTNEKFAIATANNGRQALNKWIKNIRIWCCWMYDARFKRLLKWRKRLKSNPDTKRYSNHLFDSISYNGYSERVSGGCQ